MDSDTLALHLYAKDLLTKDDWDRVHLPTKTSRDKAIFLHDKILDRGKEGFDILMNCLEETIEDPGHKEFYNKISSTVAHMRHTQLLYA